VLAAEQQPAPDSLADFRKRHVAARANLFTQGLRLCQAPGRVKLGQVAWEGTKVKANAAKPRALSDGRLAAAAQKREEEGQSLLGQAAAVDSTEAARYGPGQRGAELPAELARRESRLRKIRAAKAALEHAATAVAAAAAAAAQATLAARQQYEAETGQKAKGRAPTGPDPAQARPAAQAPRTCTDPDARILKDGARTAVEQADNAPAAVDSQAQSIVAAAVTQDANDQQHLGPMLLAVQENRGQLPEKASADTGFFSEANLTAKAVAGVDLSVPPERAPHTTPGASAPAATPAEDSGREQMRHKLNTPEGQAVYKLRKASVAPVFGQIKDGRGFRRFSFRGLLQVGAEWTLICLTPNLLKRFRGRRGLLAA